MAATVLANSPPPPPFAGRASHIPTRFDPGDVFFGCFFRPLFLLLSYFLDSPGTSPLAAPPHLPPSLLLSERITLPPAARGHLQRGGIDHAAVKQTIRWYSASSSIPRAVMGSDAQQ